MSTLLLEQVSFSYEKTAVLKNISFEFESGNMYAIVGKSGAGKTTLLSVLSGLAEPSSGRILYNGEDVSRMNKYDFRSKCIGVIFQNFNLLTKLTAVENVVLSMEISGIREKGKTDHAYQILESVGIDREEADRRVLKLSGGQQQRVAIARTLAYSPDIILADEPTGNLDGETQGEIISIFKRLASEGKCVIVVTHSPEVAKSADKIYELVRNKK
ncbi:MAG: ABC transporter ATP-binding protein [Candidatus Howiella sp.]|jgi:putative ABC transport system ATP-binding protein